MQTATRCPQRPLSSTRPPPPTEHGCTGSGPREARALLQDTLGRGHTRTSSWRPWKAAFPPVRDRGGGRQGARRCLAVTLGWRCLFTGARGCGTGDAGRGACVSGATRWAPSSGRAQAAGRRATGESPPSLPPLPRGPGPGQHPGQPHSGTHRALSTARHGPATGCFQCVAVAFLSSRGHAGLGLCLPPRAMRGGCGPQDGFTDRRGTCGFLKSHNFNPDLRSALGSPRSCPLRPALLEHILGRSGGFRGG